MPEVDRLKFEYYDNLLQLAYDLMDVYVDLFLLWLLYRFMKPQETLRNGNSISSTTLFAHDHEAAGQNLKHSLISI